MDNEKFYGGAFFVARKLFQSDIWLYKPSSWKIIWIYILGKVNHKNNGKFKRGEGYFNFTNERKSIGNDITPDTIKKFLRFARDSLMVSTNRSTRGMVIKIINYNRYQILENYKAPLQAPVKAREKHERSTPINKNDNNEEELAETSSALKVKSKDMKTYDENKHSDSDIPEIDIEVNETITHKIQTKKYPNAKVVFALFGKHPANWKINKTQLQSAENLFAERGVEQIIKALSFLKENREDKFCPQVNSPYDLDSKWAKMIGFKKRQ